MAKFSQDADYNNAADDDAMAIAIPRVFSENSRDKQKKKIPQIW